MLNAFKNHWPEYLIEAWCLGTFMVSACFFGVLLFNPSSPAASVDPAFRNVLMGLAMGLTAIGIITSPLGRRSGAHFNPGVTLTFLRLGKIAPVDASFYILFQFLGGLAGVLLSWLVLGRLLADGAVNFVATLPGRHGVAAAFVAEAGMSFVMMTVILFTSHSTRLARLTPVFAASLVAIFIAIENPISGMSINPARTFASAAVSGNWTGSWIYFTGPPIAMLAAGEFFLRARRFMGVQCAKLHHFGVAPCGLKSECVSLARFRDARETS
jgi:aquaporin Z